jgi:predicted membrane-bound spermidine synthase
VLSLLYFSNSLGAAIGVLVAGFVLIRMAGLHGTLTAAAIINMVVGIATLAAVRYFLPYLQERSARRAQEREWMARTMAEHDAAAAAVAGAGAAAGAGALAAGVASDFGTPVSLGAPVAIPDAGNALWRLLLAVSFGTAVASFIYEIAWIRMLSLVLGSATHSFELMLSAFILGLALGAFWIRKRTDRIANPIAALGNVQWLMGAAALATLPVYLASFGWTAGLLGAVQHNNPGYELFTVARYVFCLAVMLPSTFLAGITLPLITRTLFSTPRGESAIGAVYGVNTLGSIVGVAAAGLILMPLLGLKYLLIFGAAIDMALGVALLAYDGRRFSFGRPLAVGAGLALIAAVALATTATRFDRTILASGVFRTGSVPPPGARNIVFFEDGRTATVSVRKDLSDSLVVISTNGKPDASLTGHWFREDNGQPFEKEPLGSDVSTQLLLPLVTLAHMPTASVAAIIGHGSGMSSHFLLGSTTLRDLYTIEIEPMMIAGSREFLPANFRVHEDPRSHHIIDDAKSYFAATKKRFDLILSEPSNPWVSGVSGLFTVEFYQRIRNYLTDDGVFGQWLHLYEINDGLVLSVLAALHRSFPSYEIFQTSSGDILIVASLKEQLPAPDWSVFDAPAIRTDLWHAVPFDSLTLEATRVLDRRVLAPLLDEWEEPNSDFYPVLDLGTERTRFQHETADGFSAMWTQGFNVSAALMGRVAGPNDDQLALMPGIGAIFSRALSARERKGGPATDAELDLYPGLADFLYREWQFNAILASPEPPQDWRRFALEFMNIEEDLHRGTAGFIDTVFYSRVASYLRRFNAPLETRLSIDFLRGVAEWNFAAVSALADSVLHETDGYPSLLSADFMRDAGTVAKIRIRDVDGAREYYNNLLGQGSRSPTHFQSRLLDAHLRAAEMARLIPQGTRR